VIDTYDRESLSEGKRKGEGVLLFPITGYTQDTVQFFVWNITCEASGV